jgi:REP element-mobilizing transposase RayT
MILNEFGRIVQDEWIKSASIRREIELDEFVVMPNHFHAIVKIVGGCRRGDRPVAPTEPSNTFAPNKSGLLPHGPEPNSIGSLMAGYKSIVTARINALRGKPGEKVWQRNYFERIIWNDQSLNQTRKYINLNPERWDGDEFNR